METLPRIIYEYHISDQDGRCDCYRESVIHLSINSTGRVKFKERICNLGQDRQCWRAMYCNSSHITGNHSLFEDIRFNKKTSGSNRLRYVKKKSDYI